MGISRHIEMQDLPPVVADDEKAVQNTKRERWDGEEVHRCNCLAIRRPTRMEAVATKTAGLALFYRLLRDQCEFA